MKCFKALFTEESCIRFERGLLFVVCSDVSNVDNIKIFPYTVQHFHEKNKVCQKLLNFYEEFQTRHLLIYFNALKK